VKGLQARGFGICLSFLLILRQGEGEKGGVVGGAINGPSAIAGEADAAEVKVLGLSYSIYAG
jgi:hypothetical protein